MLRLVDVDHGLAELSQSVLSVVHKRLAVHVLLHKTLLRLEGRAELSLQNHVFLLQMAVLALKIVIDLLQLRQVALVRGGRANVSALVVLAVVGKPVHLQEQVRTYSVGTVLVMESASEGLLRGVADASVGLDCCRLLEETLGLIADGGQTDVVLHLVDVDVLRKHELLHVVDPLQQLLIQDAGLEGTQLSLLLLS